LGAERVLIEAPPLMETAKQSTDKLSAIIANEIIPALSIAEVWHR